MIDGQWLQTWAKYMEGKGEPPERISNLNLYKNDGTTLKDDLVPKRDYRGIVRVLVDDAYDDDDGLMAAAVVVVPRLSLPHTPPPTPLPTTTSTETNRCEPDDMVRVRGAVREGHGSRDLPLFHERV